MCEYSGRLIAWMDQELPGEEATNVEWHVAQCAECRRAVTGYAEVSGAFLACYQAAMAVHPRRKTSLWALGGVAAAAAILAAILLAHPRAEQLSMHIPPPPEAPAIAFEKPAMKISVARARRAPAPRPIRTPWIAVEPTVEVALPADALFPPGAVPQGFSFIADVRP
jgi:hypothetical protein